VTRFPVIRVKSLMIFLEILRLLSFPEIPSASPTAELISSMNQSALCVALAIIGLWKLSSGPCVSADRCRL
jgi:hypothetical protein